MDMVRLNIEVTEKLRDAVKMEAFSRNSTMKEIITAAVQMKIKRVQVNKPARTVAEYHSGAMVRINVEISKDIKRQADLEALKIGMTGRTFVTQAINEYMQNTANLED